MSPKGVAVNQISLPLGDHATPCSAVPLLRKGLSSAGPINERQAPGVVSSKRMVDEGDRVPSRRDARVADPARGFVEPLPDRELQTHLRSELADHSQVDSVRRPVGRKDVLEDFPRRVARDRHLGERSHGLPEVHEVAAEGESQLSRGGDRKDVGARKGERKGFGAARASGKELHGHAVPGRAVDDRMAVRGKPGREDIPAAKRQPSEGRGRDLAGRAGRERTRRTRLQSAAQRPSARARDAGEGAAEEP